MKRIAEPDLFHFIWILSALKNVFCESGAGACSGVGMSEASV